MADHLHNIHDVVDTDPHFIVDMMTRTISDQSPVGTNLMQYDHNSQRLTFEMPLTIDGHKMNQCNRVEVHFINIGSNGKRTNGSIYPVDDLAINTEDPENEKITFTWLVSRDATQYAGSLSFALKFICDDEEGHPIYVWNTEVCTSISIGVGMDYGNSIATQYNDLLTVWYVRFIADGSDHIKDMEGIGEKWSLTYAEVHDRYIRELSSATANAKAEIRQTGEVIVTKLINEELGRDHLDEVILPAIDDAKTEAIAEINSKADDIVNVVLSRLPRAEEATF